ncbi:MAG: hypothetical protein PHT54_03530 [Candidatus Nanoarchaeia archaeon]|nr:hypothetical protein [Candidatus Nanoarchaeia archaeon]
MPQDELEQKIVDLQNQIDELNGLISKNQYSNTIIETKQIIQQEGFMQSPNYSVGISGWKINSDGNVEFNEGDFRGNVDIGSLDIPNSITANSFHVDTEGNAWWGATTIGSATAKILKTGVAYFTDITITGGTFINTAATLAEARLNTLFKSNIFIGSNSDGLTSTAATGGGSVTRYLENTVLATGDNASFSTLVSVAPGISSSIGQFICYVKVSNSTQNEIFWGRASEVTGLLNGVLTSSHVGFIVDRSGNLYASSCDGVTQVKSDAITGITLTNYNIYRINFTGSALEFYINDVLKATISTHLDWNEFISFAIANYNGAGTRYLYVGNSYTLIDNV